MKKLFIGIAILGGIMLSACDGKKTDKDDNDSDSIAAESTQAAESISNANEMLADGVDVAPNEQWTEDAVAKQMRKIYTEVSKTYSSKADGMENNTDLYGMFCTNDFNELQRQIRVITGKTKADDRRFENEEIRWTYGMDLPVTPQNIKVTLLTGNMAEATFELHSGEQWMYTKLGLDWENGQWKISSWKEVGDDNNDLFDEMYKYVEANK